MIVDTVIKNCRIISPWGISTEGIGIKGGEIVALAKDTYLPEATRTIDAKGNYVMPGVIDPHVHMGTYHSLTEDSTTIAIAAALGGVTTLGVYLSIGLYSSSDGLSAERFDEWKEIYETHALVDAFFHGRVYSAIDAERILDTTLRYGLPSHKFSMAYKGFEGQQLGMQGIDDGIIFKGFKAIAPLGYPARAMVHAENIDVIFMLKKDIESTGRQDLAAWTDVRPGFCEFLDAERAISIARVVNAPLYIVHISAAQTVNAVAKAKAEGVDVIGETCPQYLTLTKDAPLGPLGKANPSLKDQEDIAELWGGIREGTIECLGSDHVTSTRKMKQDMWTGVPGFTGTEYILPLMLSEGVDKGRITLEKLVEVCCYNNARVFGIYPRKGIIRIGSDADLVIIDLNKKKRVPAKTKLQLTDFCVYEGWELKGWPILTMVRGDVIAEDENIIAKPGIGKYIKRSLAG
jgi:dihydroorotase-like cyclic amidohydrolase